MEHLSGQTAHSQLCVQAHSCCTTPGAGISKMLSFLCDGQGAARQAVLYMDRSYFSFGENLCDEPWNDY